MYPVLFEIGGFPVNSFGVLVALGVWVGSWAFQRRAKKYGISSEAAWDLCFWLMITGTLGARILFIILNWGQFSNDISQLFTFRFEGLTSYGALIGGIPTAFLWAKKHRVNFVHLVDSIALPYFVGHAIGRLGCFTNGCCYGCIDDNLPWGVCFQNVDKHLHHPTQLYDTFLSVISIAIILFLESKNKLKPLQSMALVLFFYNGIRIIEEIWRQGLGGSSTTLYAPFSSAQIFSIVLVLISIMILVRANKNELQ